jgi:uncharacterized protein YbjT (DUF2867 family)
MGTILVTGASGNIGSALVGALTARGADYRIGTRTPQSFDAGRAVRFDFDDPSTMEPALEGIDRVFILTPFDPQLGERAVRAIDAARRAGVRHVVRLSALRAEAEPDSARRWHRAAERHLEASGLGWTILRPGSFMQNLSGYLAPVIRKFGGLPLAFGDARVGLVDTRDVGEAAAVVLTEPGHEGRAYALTGSKALTYDAVAETLSAAAGRTIRYIRVSPEEAAAGARGAGYPEWLVSALLEMDADTRAGGGETVTQELERLLGRPPRSLEEFARDHAHLWR